MMNQKMGPGERFFRGVILSALLGAVLGALVGSFIMYVENIPGVRVVLGFSTVGTLLSVGYYFFKRHDYLDDRHGK